MRPLATRVLAALVLLGAAACRSEPAMVDPTVPPLATSGTNGSAGTLLAIGGGLDDDNAPVFERFVALARRGSTRPRVVIVTAASGDEEDMATGKIAALRTWSPGLPCVAVKRETPTADTIAAIDAATALFFTGGDQKRIVDRYRPGDADGPEWAAMRRLLARGGVIAGSSAGLAMMSEVMLLGGRSASALGAPAPPGEDGAATATGPRFGPGMRFLPWAVTDSHFFERDRVGRLVAALEAAGRRLGLGIGEDGCVEIDLANGTVTGVAVSESLLVDSGAMTRDGTARRACVATRIRRGDTLSLPQHLRQKVAPAPRPHGEPLDEVVAEEGQNRQLASWRLFARASQDGMWQLTLDGWRIVAWPQGDGRITFDIELTAN